MKIDEYNVIVEELETNNNASIDVNVRSADLSSTSNDISFSHKDFITNETIKISAIIHNIGLANATNVLVNFYVEENLIGNDTIDVAGNNTQIASIIWVITLPIGEYTLYVRIDEKNIILEENETNNIGSTMIKIRENVIQENQEQPLDTDGDGIPDMEDQDDDNDGFTDLEELEEGTDPLDPSSYPEKESKKEKSILLTEILLIGVIISIIIICFVFYRYNSSKHNKTHESLPTLTENQSILKKNKDEYNK